MQLIDWTIIAVFAALLLGVAVYFHRYTKSVADFLSANRCAKRYLLTAAEGAAGLGTISIVAQFEMFGSAGYTVAYWNLILMPISLILALSGWILYRFRQTRCMTMAQFLELRYGRSFRIAAGFMSFLSGIINYGIFPGVTARFFIYALGIPDMLILGGLSIPTMVPMMLLLLSIGLTITMTGGQVVIIVTDFLQGQLINTVFVIAAIVVLMKISWPEIGESLAQTADGASMTNPFDTAKAETFSYWFFLIIIFGRFYGYMSWQGSQAYNSSAKTPHEARMASIIGQWRMVSLTLIPMMLAIGAYVLLNHPHHVEVAQSVQSELSSIANETIQEQMRTPIALRYMLPGGILGLFIAIMLACGISTDSTYLHSWGSIFLQDVVMPFRKTPFDQKTHLRLLRLSALGVAVFAFFFSLLFQQTEYIIMFFQLTGAIFSAWAGACIIGGLYWRRGTIQGAWAAMITGVTLVATGFTLDRINPDFPLNYIQVVFTTQLISVTVYVVVSLISGRGRKFDLDRMLHRGVHAKLVEDAPENVGSQQKVPDSIVSKWQRRLGINSDFTRSDKILYYLTIGLLLTMLLIFFGGLAWNFTAHPDHQAWMAFWKVFVIVQLALAVGTTLWILVGGMSNLKDMVADLKGADRNEHDDGFVDHGHNAGEENVFEEIAVEENNSR